MDRLTKTMYESLIEERKLKWSYPHGVPIVGSPYNPIKCHDYSQ